MSGLMVMTAMAVMAGVTVVVTAVRDAISMIATAGSRNVNRHAVS